MDSEHLNIARDLNFDRSQVLSSIAEFRKKSRSLRKTYWFMILMGWLMIALSVAGVVGDLHFSAQRLSPPGFSVPGTITVLGVLIAGLGFTMLRCRWISTSGAKVIHNKLLDSDLAVLIASGNLEPEAMFKYIPKPFHLGLKKASPNNLSELLEQVASHLNWYLKPPRLYLPNLEILVFPAYILVAFLTMDRLSPVIQGGMLLCFIPSMINSRWRMVSFEEFAEYIDLKLKK